MLEFVHGCDDGVGVGWVQRPLVFETVDGASHGDGASLEVAGWS